MTPKARKTYVLAFYDNHGQYRQAYFQNRKEALHVQRNMRACGKVTHLSFWIDGSEMVRLARLGYRYDSRTDKTVKSRNAKGFYEGVMAMPEKKRRAMFLDYRNFKTNGDVVKFMLSIRGQK